MALLLDEPAVRHLPQYITVNGIVASTQADPKPTLMTSSQDPPKLDLDSYIANYEGIIKHSET